MISYTAEQNTNELNNSHGRSKGNIMKTLLKRLALSLMYGLIFGLIDKYVHESGTHGVVWVMIGYTLVLIGELQLQLKAKQ